MPKKLPPHYAIPKSEGNAPVQAWIDLLPDWQSDRARHIDAIVTREVPNVQKAVKWHGAWYGIPNKGWILAMASFKAHLKLAFFDGALLKPTPPVPLAAKGQAAFDIREPDKLNEKEFSDWIKQASKLPGWGKV